MGIIVELKPKPFIRCVLADEHEGACRLTYEGRGQTFSHVFGNLKGAMIFARYAARSTSRAWSNIKVEAAFGETVDPSGSSQLLEGIDWTAVVKKNVRLKKPECQVENISP